MGAVEEPAGNLHPWRQTVDWHLYLCLDGSNVGTSERLCARVAM